MPAVIDLDALERALQALKAHQAQVVDQFLCGNIGKFHTGLTGRPLDGTACRLFS